jgi:hypothetical protein
MVFDVLDNQCMQVVSIVSRVTVISFMASEIDRLESSTLQMLIDSIDQVVDVGYQFGLVCSIHRCLTDDGIVFRLNVIGIHVELCLPTFSGRFTCSIRDDIERGSVPTGLTPLTFPVPIFSSTTIFKRTTLMPRLSL